MRRANRYGLLLALAATLLVQSLALRNAYPFIANGTYDFGHIYTATVMLREGQGDGLYDLERQAAAQRRLLRPHVPRAAALPFNHPPTVAISLLPLSLLDVGPAHLVMAALNALALFVTMWLLWRRRSDQPIAWTALLLVAGTGWATFWCLLQGQTSLLTVLLIAAAMLMMAAGQDGVSGALLGAAMIRFQLVVPLALLVIIATRRWRALRGLVAAVAMHAAVSMLVLGPGVLLEYPRFMLRYAALPDGPAGVASIWMPNLRGLLTGVLGAPRALAWIAAGTLLLISAWIASRIRDEFLRWAFAVPAALLCSLHANLHDLTALLVCGAALRLAPVAAPSRLRSAAVLSVIGALVLPAWRMSADVLGPALVLVTVLAAINGLAGSKLIPGTDERRA